MSTMMTTKGQVTVPKRIRDLLGIGPGTAVDFVVEADGRVVLHKAGAPENAPQKQPVSRFARLAGTAGPGMSTDEIMALTRGG